MKAAVFDGKEIKIKEVAKPQPNESQVLIKLKSSGICGTDIAIIEGTLPTPTPLIPGHEFSGIVEEVGTSVEREWLGKKVTSEINANIDFNCFYCRRKLYTQCISRKAIGIDINGSFAEYIAVGSYLLHEVPKSISFNEATFIEPLAAAYQTFETMPLENDDKVMAIFGLGKLGLVITQVALLNGLELIVVDGPDRKLLLAKKFGAHHLINRFNIKSIPEEIKRLTNGLGADIVVDTTGNPESIKDIINSCRTRGKLHIKSTHGLDTPVNITDIVVRELTLYSSRCGPFEKAIDGLKSKKVVVKELISNEYPLISIKEALNSYKKSRDHIKTILKC